MGQAQGGARRAPSVDDQGVIEGELVQSEIIEQNASNLARRGDELEASLAVALSESEIDKQIQTAHRFPRSITRAVNNIMELATLDRETAQESIYALPRDGKAITGPSIRFAELVAQQWGNNRVAGRVIAVDRREGFVEAEGVYHDLETNTAIAARVRARIKGKGGRLFSDDMIGVTSNAATSKAIRNAILRGIPKPVWKKPYEKCQQVVRGDAASLGARRVELIKAFRDNLGIQPDKLYTALGVKGEMDIGLDQLVVASGFYSALRQNEVTIDDLIRAASPGAAPTAKTLAGAFGDTGGAKTDTPAHDPVTGEIDPKADREAAEDAGAGDDAFKPAQGLNADADAPIEEDREDDAGDEGRDDQREPAHDDAGGEEEEEEDDGAEEFPVEFADFREKVSDANSWLTIKAAMGALGKTAAWKAAQPTLQHELKRHAYHSVMSLIERGQEPVSPAKDPSFFMLWVLFCDADKVRSTHALLIREPAYAKLGEGFKDEIGSLVHARLNPEG
jgi:hypothetical protein